MPEVHTVSFSGSNDYVHRHDKIRGDRDYLHEMDSVVVHFPDGTSVLETVRVIQEVHGDAYDTDYIYNRTYVMKRDGVLVSLQRNGVDVIRAPIAKSTTDPMLTLVIWEDGPPKGSEPPVQDDFFTNLMGDE